MEITILSVFCAWNVFGRMLVFYYIFILYYLNNLYIAADEMKED